MVDLETFKSKMGLLLEIKPHACTADLPCRMCGGKFCQACINNPIHLDVCRECQVSLLNDESLIATFDEFIFKKCREPTKVVDENGFPFAKFSFETKEVIGGIYFRSDGQLDANLVQVSSEESGSIYQILLTPDEVHHFLTAFFAELNL